MGMHIFHSLAVSRYHWHGCFPVHSSAGFSFCVSFMEAMVLVILGWERGWNLVAIEEPLPFTLSSLFLKEKKKLYIL